MKQLVARGEGLRKKDVIDVFFDEQSHYVYKNKQNMDKMPAQYVDILFEMT
jgi:hypothetical protein